MTVMSAIAPESEVPMMFAFNVGTDKGNIRVLGGLEAVSQLATNGG